MPNPIIYFEIGSPDRAKSAQFYSKLFDWQISDAGPSSPINPGSGIGGHLNSLGHEPQKYTMFYVQVDDVQAHLDKAKALGGKTLVPPVRIPTGTFAWMADPDGNIIGLLKPAP